MDARRIGQGANLGPGQMVSFLPVQVADERLAWEACRMKTPCRWMNPPSDTGSTLMVFQKLTRPPRHRHAAE
jgi:hypothetical protein